MTELVRRMASCLIALALLPGVAWAQDIRIVTYNVESDSDTSSTEVARDIEEVGGADLWALQEVNGFDMIFPLREAMNSGGRDMWFEIGLKGGSDRLAIVYDRNRFEPLSDPEELEEVGGSRPPLWMKLRERESGQAFNVVVVHFNRGNANLRREQATNLRNWAGELNEPSIVLGDFNFDLEVDEWAAGTLNGNRAYHIFTQSPSPFLWAQHAPMVKTLCNPDYNSVLDFIFLSGPARAWQVETSLLFHDDPDYCPNERLGGADHFPIAASITFAGGPESGNPNAGVLEEIRRLRQQLDALESSLRAQ